MFQKPTRNLILLMLLIQIIMSSCSTEEIVPTPYRPKNSHDAYRNSLVAAKLDQTALGKDWIAAANHVFPESVDLSLPHQEALHLDRTNPEAMGFRFSAKRGYKVIVTVSQIQGDSAILFLDVFRVVSDSLAQYTQIASADSTWQLAFEARKDAEYILRLQPELLRGGNYKLAVQHGPSLEFPVSGKGNRAIQSFFGDPRDGGRRDHHGVDIFAKRGTHIIAPSKGYVRFVGTRGIGGKVIWIHDSKRKQNLYFAHLDSHIVQSGKFVNPGDTLGTVGNTGNARTTPPHLHFGIYSNGPVDPFPFIASVNSKPEAIENTELLGQSILAAHDTFLLTAPSRKSTHVDTLAKSSPLKIEAILADYARVSSATGKLGYISLGSMSK